MPFIQHIARWLLSKKEIPVGNMQFINWAQLSDVLIIAYDHQVGNCNEFIEICKKDKIHVRVAIIYEGKPEQVLGPDFDHIILDKKQFSFFGIPTDECLRKLNSHRADVVINMGNSEQLKALALCKLVKAKCKIGSFENPVFEISINADKTMTGTEYLKQVIVYLNMIKPTKNV